MTRRRHRRETTLLAGNNLATVLRASQRVVPDATPGVIQLSRQSFDLGNPQDRLWGPTLGLRIAQQTLEHDASICVPQSEQLTLAEDKLDLCGGSRDLARFISQRWAGVIQHGPAISAAALLAQIVIALPGARIAVLGSRQTDLDRLRLRVRQSAADASIHSSLPLDASDGWMAFSSFTNAADGDIQACDAVILPDATQVVHQRASGPLCAADRRFRLIGLLRDDRRLSPLERDKVFAAFGPALLEIPASGCTRRRVYVAWSNAHGPAVAASDSLELLRRGYWHNFARNRRLARCARAAAATPRQPLIAESTMINKSDPAETCRVALLVANIEHALALAERLPGWPVLSGDADTSRMGRHRRDLLAARRGILPDGQQMIITHAAAERVELTGIDVLLWAGGGPHCPEIPASWTIVPADLHRPLILVDSRDQFDSRLARWSEFREREYAARDWFAPGVSQEFGRIKRYLAAPPRRCRLLSHGAER